MKNSRETRIGKCEVIQRVVTSLWSGLGRQEGESPDRYIFVSSIHGEGTTTIAASTAIGLARHLRRAVLVIEANCYRPGLAAHLGLSELPGLGEVLMGESSLEEAIQPTAVPGLTVLPAGRARVPEPGEFASEAFHALLDHAEREQDSIIIDAPPLLLYPEARLLIRKVTESILVLQADSTKRQQAEQAVRILESADAPFAGVVFNRYDPRVPTWLAGD